MIPLMKVHSPPNIGETLQSVWDSGFVTEGEYSDRFEKEFADYIGNPNTVLTNACTNSLVLAGRLIGLREGDEVISTAMTCMATNGPFHNTGAKLVFADIDPETGNIDPESVKQKITERTKAIVLVHWGGQPCDLDEILAIAKEHNVKVVEDAAHALRSTYKGVRIGNHGDFVCFSFQAVKHLTTADGGALVCKSEEDAIRARKLRWFGLDRKFKCSSRWDQDIPEYGFKFHMNNTNAVVGLEQMKYIDGLIDSHIENAAFLRKNISNPHVKVTKSKADRVSASWLFSVLVEDKEHFRNYLADNGIASDQAHVNNLRYSVFKEYQDESLTNLKYFDKRLMNIPCGWWLSEGDLNHITQVVNNYEGL
ncbi:MAG: pyridoxal-5'-phosphate-dependent protein [Altibacter sp.]|nr:pyridoxal-5'-phosphate-dependent protein [Altibacter sp.]|tara:strand:- start:4075 stop:5172 length:1098 start_codon:yes stop_codon:yes gene_type:complete